MSMPLDDNLLDGCLIGITKINSNRKVEEKENGKHARLPAQMPASRVLNKFGGNERQERKDAVSGRKDGNRGAG